MSTEIRVALVTDSDAYAGTEAHILTLARALRKLNVDASISCPPATPLAERAEAEGIKVHAVAKLGLIDRAAVEAHAALLRRRAVQILHTHNGRTHLNAVLAVRRAGIGRCIATQHFIAPDHSTQRGPKAWLYGLAHGWTNSQTDRFIAISQTVRVGMLDRREAPNRRIMVVPNGIDAPDVRALTPPETVRAELGIGQDDPLIVCTARLQKEKDISSLVAAMKRVSSEFPSARCLVAGEGDEAGPLVTQIRELALQDTVMLLGFRKDAHALIQAADVFVLPSLAEPFGLVILEAMALGRPIVATRAGGPLEIVVDGETGVLANPADAQSLASALLRLLERPKEAARMGEAGRARFAERFQSAHMAEATREVYRNCLGIAGER